MATIAENLQKIVDIKQDIKTAIENKGVTVGDSSFTDYPTLINNIPQENTGGGDTTTYSYKIPTGDVEGLKALGWDDESIGYFRDNNLCYDWEKDNYIVTEGNKELYGVVTKDNISIYKSDPNFVYCPMIDTSNVTNMGSMFNGCTSLQSIPLLDTSEATTMYSMFNGCTSLQSIPEINTSKVTDMRSMFLGCTLLQTVPHFDTNNVVNMYALFQGCASLQTVPHFDTSNVTDMFGLFNGCKSLKSFPSFDTSKITSMGNFCANCTNLKQHPQLNIPNVTLMSTYFLSNNTTLTDAGGWLNLKCDWSDNYGLAKLPNLTYDSCINILNGLYDFRGNGDNSTTKKLRVHKNFLTTVTEEDLATATAKGWTLTA